MASERTYAQSLQDDEDHRLALCGLSDDPRLDWELEDFAQRHHDFDLHRSVTNGFARAVLGGELHATRHSPPPTFASGRRDPAPTVRSGPKAAWEGSGPHQGSRALGPPPLSKT